MPDEAAMGGQTSRSEQSEPRRSARLTQRRSSSPAWAGPEDDPDFTPAGLELCSDSDDGDIAYRPASALGRPASVQGDEAEDMQEDDDDDDGEGGSEGAWVVEDDADSDEGDTEAPHYVFFARHGLRDRRERRQLVDALEKYGRAPRRYPKLEDHFAQMAEQATAADTPKHRCWLVTAPCKMVKRGELPLINMQRMLKMRQCNLANSGSGWTQAQRSHVASHYLPNRPLRHRAHMQSRAYIGQFSRHGNLFVAAFQLQRRVLVYNTDREWEVRKDIHARNVQWTITDTSLSRDQNFLVYASITPTVNVDVGGVESEANVTEIHEALHFDQMHGRQGSQGHFGIWSLRWAQDGREIVAGTGNHSIYVFDMEKQKARFLRLCALQTTLKIRAHQDDVNAVAFLDESSNIIVSGSDDNFIKVWDRRALDGANRPAGVLVGHTEGVTHLDARGDGRYVLSNAKDQTAKLWDVRRMTSWQNTINMHRRDLGLPNLQWDYRWMEYPGRGWNIRHPHDASLMTFRGHSVQTTLIRAYFSPAFTTGQRFVYTGDSEGGCYIYDTLSGELIDRLKYHREVVRDVSWHPYEPTIVTACFDGTLLEWGYSEETMQDAKKKLPDPSWDTLEEQY